MRKARRWILFLLTIAISLHNKRFKEKSGHGAGKKERKHKSVKPSNVGLERKKMERETDPTTNSLHG